jgi:hypothetical protein
MSTGKEIKKLTVGILCMYNNKDRKNVIRETEVVAYLKGKNWTRIVFLEGNSARE